jgi:hypothetical protein
MTVATPGAFEMRWGFAPPDGHDGPRLCAYRLAVADPGAARARVEASGVAAAFEAGRIVIAPQDLFGCGLVMAARERA